MLRRVGADWDIPTLLDDGEIPLERVDGHIAGVIGSGIGDADAYYAGHHEDGAIVFLLRSSALLDEPFEVTDVTPVLDLLVVGGLPVTSARAALQGFADEPLPGFEARVSEREAVVETSAGTFRIEFDKRGRARHLEAELDALRITAPEPEPDGELTPIGSLQLSGGPVAIFDPLFAVDPMFVEPRAGALPAGTFDVAVEIEDDRVVMAHILLGDTEPIQWQPVGSVRVDSGICCFASPEAARRLVEEGEPALERLESGLASAPYVALDGLVAFPVGVGAGEYELMWAFDKQDQLVRASVRVLPEPPYEEGLQRAVLFPLAAGGTIDDENVIPLPPVAHRRLAAQHRRMIRASLAGHELEASVIPHYDGASAVPARVEVSVDAGSASFRETIEVATR
jgi:hypothetical protein